MTTPFQRRRKIFRSSKLDLYVWASSPLFLKNVEFASSFLPESYVASTFSFGGQRNRSFPFVVRVPNTFQRNRLSILFSSTVLTHDFDNMELWQAGDLEEDLKNLEMALTHLNADQNRYHDERLEALDYFAQSRRPIALHIRRFILEPLIWSLLLSFTMQRLRLVRPFRIVSLVQFWSASVMAPCILLCLIIRIKTKSKVETSCPDASETEYYQNLSYLTKSSKFWSAPEDLRRSDSTSDYVQCLLEQWVSCILGGIVAGVSWLAITLVQPVRFRTNVVLFVQMITRFGIIASLHQYPPLWFALNRKQQPHPLNWPVWATQQLIRNQWFKLCATVDVALLALSYPSIYRCYVPAIALTTTLWCFAVQSERWINDSKGNTDASLRTTRRGILENRMHQLARIVQPLSVSACLLWMWYFSQSIVDFAQRFLESLTTTRFSSFIGMFGYKLAAGACLLIALVGPICHITAVSKLFQASFMHNASLSMDPDLFRKSVSAWRWRYCLKWREPKRIGVVLEQWWNRFWYWLFLKGSVDEKLQQESEKLLRGGSSVQSRGLSVWQRVATEPSTYSGMDRTQWKTKAMERIARKHQYDYDRGSFDVSDQAFAC
jgi:hypothetical protein